jgi:hypothetical protein
MLGCILTFIALMFIGVYMDLQTYVIVIIDLGLTILLFRTLRGKAVLNCVAKLGETYIEFDFEKGSRVINFSDLISYKVYYGKNGPILYLKNTSDNFKIFANNNFCKTEHFIAFCKDTIVQLDTYKSTHNSNIIHEGSIYATKAMLYFLIAVTSIYLIGFFIESKTARLAVGLGGGWYLLMMWIIYSKRSKLKSN